MDIDNESSTCQVSCSSDASRSSRSVVYVFSYITVSLIFFQKIGLNFAGGTIGIGIIVLWFGLGHLAFVGALRVRLDRLALFIIFICAALGGALALGDMTRPQAFGIVIISYASLIFVVEVAESTKLACLLRYQNCMTIVSWIVIFQQLTQYTIGASYWPNFERVIPQALFIDGYAYIRPYHWHSQYLTPNGIFFLEPSAVSACMGIAFIVEAAFFRKPLRLGLYLTALLAGVAVSGIAIVTLASPFLLFKFSRRLMVYFTVLSMPFLLMLSVSGLLGNITSRTGELSNKQSSGYARIMVPLNTLTTLAFDTNYSFSGAGAGQSSKGKDEVQWPFTKLLYEYGLISALIFHVYLVSATLLDPPSFVLAAAILIPHLCFGGGFVSHVNVVIIVLFCSLLRQRQVMSDPT